jgi:hypothetical protein
MVEMFANVYHFIALLKRRSDKTALLLQWASLELTPSVMKVSELPKYTENSGK